MKDILANRRRRRRRQGEYGRVPELRDDSAEREVGGTKVVAPLADAVRFVDDEERHANRLQQTQKDVVFELLRRRIDDADRTGANALARAQLLVFGKGRIQRDDVGDPAIAEHVELILHQSDQRADNDRGSFEQERRQLVGEALSRSSRQNGKRVLTSEDARNDLFLAWIKASEAKPLLERRAQIDGSRDVHPTNDQAPSLGKQHL